MLRFRRKMVSIVGFSIVFCQLSGSIGLYAQKPLSDISASKKKIGTKAQRVLNHQLTLAAADGQTQRVQMLLDRGANPNGNGPEGAPLPAAVMAGDLESVRLLVSHGANVNIQYWKTTDNTPLTLAVFSRSSQIVTYLLSHKADPNLADTHGNTPLHIGALTGYPDPYVLLKYGANPALKNIEGQTAYDIALQQNRDIWIVALAQITPGAKGPVALRLIAAVKQANVPQVEAILKVDTHVDTPDSSKLTSETPLMLAIDEYHIENDNIDPIHVTLRQGKPSSGASSGLARQQRIYQLRHQFNEIVEMLLKHGASVHQHNKLGDKPLNVAASFGNIKDVEALLKYGAKADDRDAEGITALMSAMVAAANPHLISFIFGGLTFRHEYQQILSVLLSHGADINAQDQNGRTALILATNGDNADPIRWLLAAGAKPDIQDKTGKTALDYAQQNKDEAAISLLTHVHS